MKHKGLNLITVCIAFALCTTACGKKGGDTTALQTEDTTDNTVTSAVESETVAQPEETGGALIGSGQNTLPFPSVTEEPADYDDKWNVATMEEQILASNTEWSVAGKPVYKNGYMGSDNSNTMFDITCLREIGPEEVYRFEFELNTPKTETVTDNVSSSTLFVGLRIESDWGVADEDNGFWISFKDNVMGIKTVSETTWNNGISEYKLPYGFNDGFRRVCIVDNRVENTVDVYLSNDQGQNSLVYKLKLAVENGKNYVYIHSYIDNFETVVDVLELTFEISMHDTGYVKLWNHNRGKVYLKNLAMKVI